MAEIETPARFFEYKGERLKYHSGGGTWKRVVASGDLDLEHFPEALEFSSDPADPWVMLPNTAFDALYVRTVSGRWHGVPVEVESVVKRGLSKGQLEIAYTGTQPDEAVAAGLRGNQNDGWRAMVDPSELEDVAVDETMYPLADGR
jgi:hypothetical protein